MLEGPQREVFDLSFAVPSVCAEQLRNGQADIGIVPVAALLDQRLEIFRGTGIASNGPVRTILLISRRPFANIEALAVDSSSRTSVMLSRIILRNAYNVNPDLITMAPSLGSMLDAADAALIIGDPALLLDPSELRARGLHVADLGEHWTRMSGLPMVFAVWAGRKAVHTPENVEAFAGSCRYGLDHLEDLIAREHARRGVTAELARRYLTSNLVLELGEREYRGMETFLQAAAALPPPRYLQMSGAAQEKPII